MSVLTSPTKRRYRLGKSYLDLLKRFPLMSIRSEEENAKKLAERFKVDAGLFI